MSTWMPVLQGPEAAEAVRIAREVGRRLRDREPSASSDRGPAGVAQSDPGLAIAFAQVDACLPGEGWDTAAHAEIARSAEALRGASGVPTGLFTGLAGTAFAANFVDAKRYERLLGTVDGLIARRLDALLARLDARGGGYAEHEIDVVSGLAGIGAHALECGDQALLRPAVERLERVLNADGSVPGWYTPPELLDEHSRTAFPSGRLNCGLAHGVPGPLAFLALAGGAGIRHAADWLVENSIADEWGVNWPYSVPDDQPARAAWCYGAPGVSRALWLAGVTLDDAGLRELAVEALEAVFRRPRDGLRLDGATFCHGVAGVLQISVRMAADSGSDRLREAATDLAAELIERYEADSLFGYRGLDPDNRPEDQPGLLEGAAGVALVLLAAATSEPPRWDR